MMKHANGLSAGVILAVLALWGCGREADKAARVQNEASAPAAATASSPGRDARDAAGDAGRQEASSGARAPEAVARLWAVSRKYSAGEAAERQFERNGADFGAGDVEAYVKKARAFVTKPPRSVQTVTRANGDTLYYDPAANVFAVADKDGAPRTMFKPRDGMAYWTAQKQRGADQASGRGGRSRGAQDDESAG